MATETEEALEHAHSGLGFGKGDVYFCMKQRLANSCHLMHL